MLPITALADTSKTDIPAAGMVTMVDLGATECIPCKMMAPIMEEVEKEYEGRAAVFFLDVWKKPDEAQRFSIRTIPTQIFYDAAGKEVWRHEGFLDKKTIVAVFDKLGVK
jgi:thioredoxin 1